tara:strand:- start:2137 stop:2592 length:456 start_codon:yes stop_codon:yes gene_type:complete
MALKPDRVEHLTDLSFFLNEVAERGQFLIVSTAGSGAAMDDSTAKAAIATGSGKPLGLLLNDVVDLDLTRQHINFAKDEVQKGSKVLILRRGTVVTNKIETGISPAGGDIAYYKSDGELTTDVDSTPVGQFLSSKDADGYAKVEINVIPNV